MRHLLGHRIRSIVSTALLGVVLSLASAGPVAASTQTTLRTCHFTDRVGSTNYTLTLTTKIIWNGNTGYIIASSYKLSGGPLSTSRYDWSSFRYVGAFWGTQNWGHAVNDNTYRPIYYTAGEPIGYHRSYNGTVSGYDWWIQVKSDGGNGCNVYYWSDDIAGGYIYTQ